MIEKWKNRGKYVYARRALCEGAMPANPSLKGANAAANSAWGSMLFCITQPPQRPRPLHVQVEPWGVPATAVQSSLDLQATAKASFLAPAAEAAGFSAERQTQNCIRASTIDTKLLRARARTVETKGTTRRYAPGIRNSCTRL